jgi:hypothetical protein
MITPVNTGGLLAPSSYATAGVATQTRQAMAHGSQAEMGTRQNRVIKDVGKPPYEYTVGVPILPQNPRFRQSTLYPVFQVRNIGLVLSWTTRLYH